MASTNRNTLVTAEVLCFLGSFSLGYVENVANTLAPFTPAEKAGIATDQIPALLDGFTTGSFAGVRGLTPAILKTVTIAYQTAFSKAVQIVYLISIAFGVLAIGGALLSPNPDSKFNTYVSRRMHGKENIAAEHTEVV
jgi:hypothetical protein